MARDNDLETFEQMEPLLEELWAPLRFLTDLRATWPKLTEEQRRDIEGAVVYRDHFHENLVKKNVKELLALARQIKSLKNRRLRTELVGFLKHWRKEEPDKVKIFLGILRTELRGSRRAEAQHHHN